MLFSHKKTNVTYNVEILEPSHVVGRNANVTDILENNLALLQIGETWS